jgi:hypothetical protein
LGRSEDQLRLKLEWIILSDELTKTNAAEIGMITITTASITLLKNALNEGVMLVTDFTI